MLDLTHAVVVAPASLSAREQRAATMLVEEVEKRTGIRWERRTTWPESTTPAVALGPVSALDAVAGRQAGELRQGPNNPGAEGFRLVTRSGPGPAAPAVLVLGQDSRGVLFGAGRLLRELRMSRSHVALPDTLDITTAPNYPLRVHQLGYRPKTHSYDAWDLPVWEQYYRDLIVFGCNAVALIPPRSDDAADITHTRQCQYPVPDWDAAFAVTEARECINPRPVDEAAIFRATQPDTIGFITYSEGCSDDVNKAVWSALGWDPESSVPDILRDYARYFIGDRFADPFAQGLLALEQNWRGPVAANPAIDVTLAQFQSMERDAPPALRRNWRFQQALYRAYYDAYTRRRLAHETALEAQALACLRQAPARGTSLVLAEAEQILDRALTDPVASDWRQRIHELGEALFQSIAMQLSVERHHALTANLGFDFLWFEMEHSPITLENLRNIILATRGTPAIPIARPPVNELWQAKRVLDAGALGVIFPFTSTAELARQAVAACRYPPAGLRGSGASLAQLRWPAPGGYYDFADREVLVIAMIEDALGVENIDAIAATPGLDVLFVGPSDLSFSLGLRGAQEDPRLHAAIDRVIAAGRRHGKYLGRPALTPDEIHRHTAQGFQFFMGRTDLELLTDGARDLLGPRFTDPTRGGGVAG